MGGDCRHILPMSATEATAARLLTLPNVITIGRLALVPVMAWMMLTGQWVAAFWVFLVAGASDAADGILARWFGQQSTLGAWLDPVADKVLMITTFVLLVAQGIVPIWLVLIVVARDVLIMAGVASLHVTDRRVPIQPMMVSKINTVVQVGFVALVMAATAFDWALGWLIATGAVLTAILTVASLAAYARVWLVQITRRRHAPHG